MRTINPLRKLKSIKRGQLLFSIRHVLILLLLASFHITANATDQDGDGIEDSEDNCIEVTNPAQRDSNGDGYGNRCDADLDGNLVVNSADFILLRNRMYSDDPDADSNGDGMVNLADYILFRDQLNQLPGPSGTVSEPVVNENINFNQQQRLIADQFISIFENGTPEIQYDYAENIGDGRGITAGRAGFTSATGDMLIVIEKYSEIKPGNSLAIYIEELKYLEELRYEVGDRQGSASTENLDGLIEAWEENSQRETFRNVQDAVVSELYLQPARKKAKKIGARLPLTLLSLYDTNIMHGESGLNEIIKEATRRTNNLLPKGGANEISWLKNFNKYRKKVMLADDTWKDAVARVTELQDLIKAQNYQLKKFKMVIKAYDDETHNLPVNSNNNNNSSTH